MLRNDFLKQSRDLTGNKMVRNLKNSKIVLSKIGLSHDPEGLVGPSLRNLFKILSQIIYSRFGVNLTRKDFLKLCTFLLALLFCALGGGLERN